MNLWLYLYIVRNTLYYELDVFQNTSAAGVSSRPGLGVTHLCPCVFICPLLFLLPAIPQLHRSIQTGCKPLRADPGVQSSVLEAHSFLAHSCLGKERYCYQISRLIIHTESCSRKHQRLQWYVSAQQIYCFVSTQLHLKLSFQWPN